MKNRILPAHEILIATYPNVDRLNADLSNAQQIENSIFDNGDLSNTPFALLWNSISRTHSNSSFAEENKAKLLVDIDSMIADLTTVRNAIEQQLEPRQNEYRISVIWRRPGAKLYHGSTGFVVAANSEQEAIEAAIARLKETHGNRHHLKDEERHIEIVETRELVQVSTPRP
jgi:hypothetical protein